MNSFPLLHRLESKEEQASPGHPTKMLLNLFEQLTITALRPWQTCLQP